MVEADAYGVMAAYNKVNGRWCAENEVLINQILREEWGFAGMVISDWNGTHSTVDAIISGLNVEMPTKRYLGQALLDSVKAGVVPEEIINRRVREILRVRLAISPIPEDKANQEVTPLEGIRNKTGDRAEIAYARGYEPVVFSFRNMFRRRTKEEMEKEKQEKEQLAEELTKEAVEVASGADIVLFIGGNNRAVETEGMDRENIFLPSGQDDLIRKIAEVNPNIITVSFGLTNTGRVEADEVVQAYVHRINPAAEWPYKELKAFSRVPLQPGENKLVRLDIPVKALQYWNENTHAWEDDLCDIEILVGASAGDIRLTKKIAMK